MALLYIYVCLKLNIKVLEYLYLTRHTWRSLCVQVQVVGAAAEGAAVQDHVVPEPDLSAEATPTGGWCQMKQASIFLFFLCVFFLVFPCAAARPPPSSLILFLFRPSIIGFFGMLLQTRAPEKNSCLFHLTPPTRRGRFRR